MTVNEANSCQGSASFISELISKSDTGAQLRDRYYSSSRWKTGLLNVLRHRFPNESEEELCLKIPDSMTELTRNELNEIFHMLVKLMEPHDKTIMEKIHFIPLYVDDFNAFAVRTPSDHSLCIFNSYLFESLTLLNYSLIDFCVTTPYTKAADHAQDNAIMFTGTIEQLLGRVIDNDHILRWENHFGEDPGKQFLSEGLNVTQIAFIIAHEIAHHLLGHTKKSINKSLYVGRDKINANIYSRNQQEEFDADMRAATIFRDFFKIHSSKEMALDKWGVDSLTWIGPILFMIYLECLENVQFGFMHQRKKWIDSHPPALHRRERLQQYFGGYCKNDEQLFIKNINYFFFDYLPALANTKGLSLIEKRIAID